MRTPSLVVLLLCVGPVGARAGAAHPGTVTLVKTPPRPGTVRTATDTQRLVFDFTVNGQSVKAEKVERKVGREEVLALTGGVVTRKRITYVTHEEEELKAGRVVTVTKPTQGKTFLLTAAGGKVTITDGAGRTLPPALEALVRKDHREFGEPDRIWDALPTTPIAVGADVPALAQGIQKSFERSLGRDAKPGETWTVDAVSARLRSVTGTGAARQATFAVAIRARHAAANGFSMGLDLSGEFAVRVADGWLVRLDLKGPLEILGQKQAGSLHSTQTATYP